MPSNRASRCPREIDELYDICRRIHDGHSGPGAPKKPSDFEAKRKALSRDFELLARHLVAMAAAQLGSLGSIVPADAVVRNRRERAEKAVSMLFNQDSQKPQFVIVTALQSFFDKDPAAGPPALFDRLSRIIAVCLRNVSKTETLESNSLFAYVARNVNDYLVHDPHCRKVGRWLIVSGPENDARQQRTIMARDLAALGSRGHADFSSPKSIAADILESLRGLAAGTAWLHVGELRQAVYEIYLVQIDRMRLATVQPNPEQNCLQNELGTIARRIVQETASEFQWGVEHTPEIRMAFELAAIEKLDNRILKAVFRDRKLEASGDSMSSLTEEARRRHQAGFEKFLKKVMKNWDEYNKKHHSRSN